MKKITCFVLALMLCVAGTAFAAESVPSKTTNDMTKIEVTVENAPATDAPAVYVMPVNDATVGTEEITEEHKEALDISQAEVKKLMEVVSAENGEVSDYFANIVDSEGNILTDVKEMFGTTDADGNLIVDENVALDVFEFGPIVAGNYEEEYGKVTATMLFSTPYEKDQKVVVLIGIANVNAEKKSELADGEELTADCIDDIQWVAFEGIGMDAVQDQDEAYGCISVELTPEIVDAIQKASESAGATALMAVVSQAVEETPAE